MSRRGKKPFGRVVSGLPYFANSASQKRCLTARSSTTRHPEAPPWRRTVVHPPDQGMHLVALTRRGLSDTAIERAGRRHGAIVRAISRFHAAVSPAIGAGTWFQRPSPK